MKTTLNLAAMVAFVVLEAVLVPANAAEKIKLAPGLSALNYRSDVGTVFPIVGDKMSDFAIEPGRSALIFFGATGDQNTNRQARRLVELYDKHGDNTKFIIVNVDAANQNPAAKALVQKYYPGYVPAQLLIDRNGRTTWSQVGEISRRKLSGHLNDVM